ncbi:MAG: glycerol-3-phosphate dehydrogenase/oxidase [Acidimicrobiales bacterium]
MYRAQSPVSNALERETALQRLQTETFDLLVIGGGITGAGTALDAAARGLKVALIERNDFASGTSSRSSKLVHGGIRYLQHGDISLVYEALHERQRLLANAPHLVKPLPFVIPIFSSKHSGVTRSAVAVISAALWMYDLTGGMRIGKLHSRLSRSEVFDLLPALDKTRVERGFMYYDASADDARLTLAILATAAGRYGGVCTNYVEATRLLHDNSGSIRAVAARSRLPYRKPEESGLEFEIRANVVVNATGAWVDSIRAMDTGDHRKTIHPAKGVHLSFKLSKLPVKTAGVLPVRSDRRSIFVIPWNDGSYVYAGTTDTDWQGSIDNPLCSDDDAGYILDAVNSHTGIRLTRADITASWAGVRPLLVGRSSSKRSNRTADLSRHHSVQESGSGLVTVTGGKLTTYRKMAEEAVDKAIAYLGSSPSILAGRHRSTTRHLRIAGSGDTLALRELLAPSTAKELGLRPEQLAHLVNRYGTETPNLVELASSHPGSLEPLSQETAYLKIEAIWAIKKEMACTVEDVFSRRMRLSLMDASAACQAAYTMSDMLASAWQREPVDVQREIDNFASNLDQQAQLYGSRRNLQHSSTSASSDASVGADRSQTTSTGEPNEND